MNVKAGDLAIIIHSNVSENIGRIVEVLYAAPAGVHFKLPNGRNNAPVNGAGWVIKFVGSPGKVRFTLSGINTVDFGAIHDSKLRPVFGLPIDEDVRTEERVPA